MIRYELVPDKMQAHTWRVEGMDYDAAGVLTGDHQSIAVFSGDGAEGRAHEYFDWLHEGRVDERCAYHSEWGDHERCIRKPHDDDDHWFTTPQTGGLRDEIVDQG